MKVNQLIIKEIDLDVSEVTLLSTDEYMQARDYIPSIEDIWWLRSPADYDYSVRCVCGDYSDYYFNASTLGKYGVRPALIINNTNLMIGDKLEFARHRWTVISNNIVICDNIIGRCTFCVNYPSEDANDYEKSDVKKWLEDWWNKEVEGRN